MFTLGLKRSLDLMRVESIRTRELLDSIKAIVLKVKPDANFNLAESKPEKRTKKITSSEMNAVHEETIKSLRQVELKTRILSHTK